MSIVLSMPEENAASFFDTPMAAASELCLAITDLNPTAPQSSIMQNVFGGLGLIGPIPVDSATADASESVTSFSRFTLS